MPLVGVEVIEHALEGLVGNLDGLAVALGFFEFMHVEETTVEIGDVAEQFFEIWRAVLAAPAEALVEETKQEVAVKGVELILPFFLLAALEAMAEVVAVAVEKPLLLDEIDEHQAVEHDGRIPLAVGHFADAVDERKEGLPVRVEIAVKRLGDALEVEGGARFPAHLDDCDSSLFLRERDVKRVEFLEQRFAGLSAEKFVSANRERFSGLAPNPHPRLAVAVGRGENNEMLEIRLRELSLNFKPDSVGWQPAIRSDAEPSGEPAFLGEGGQRVVLLGGA